MDSPSMGLSISNSGLKFKGEASADDLMLATDPLPCIIPVNIELVLSALRQLGGLLSQCFSHSRVLEIRMYGSSCFIGICGPQLFT